MAPPEGHDVEIFFNYFFKATFAFHHNMFVLTLTLTLIIIAKECKSSSKKKITHRDPLQVPYTHNRMCVFVCLFYLFILKFFLSHNLCLLFTTLCFINVSQFLTYFWFSVNVHLVHSESERKIYVRERQTHLLSLLIGPLTLISTNHDQFRYK